VLPPAVMDSRGFLVGEPTDHDVSTGEPRFDAFRKIGSRFETASRPITIREYQRETRPMGA